MIDGATKKGMVVLVGGKLLEKLLGFFALILYARFFVPTELALVPLMYLLGNLSLVVFGLGIMPTVVMEVPRLFVSDKERAVSLIKRALWIGVVGSAVSGLLIYLLAGMIANLMPPSGGGKDMVLWLALGVAFQGALVLLSQILMGLSRFWEMSVSNLVVSVFRLVLVLPLYQFYGAVGILAGLAAAAVIGCLLMLWQIRDVLHAPGTAVYGYGEIFRLSWPFYLEGYLMYLRGQGDQVAVTSMLGIEALAQYYLARRLYDLLKVLSDSVDSTLIPTLSRLSLGSKEQFTEKWHSLFQVGLYFSMPVAFLSAALVPFYLAVLGADKYQEALFPAVVLCMAFIADMMKVVICRSVFVLCPPVKRLQITVVEAAFLLPLLVAGTYFLGAGGAALATVVSGALAGYYAYRTLQRTLPVKVGARDWLTPLIHGGISLAAMTVVIVGLQSTRAGWQWLGGATLLGMVAFSLLYINLMSKELFAAVMGNFSSGKWAMAGSVLLKLRFDWR